MSCRMKLAGIALACALPSSAVLSQVPACLSAPGTALAAPDILVTPLEHGDGSLESLRVEAPRGAHMLVYYDAPSRMMALDRAACLGIQIALLQDELGDTREGAEWDSVVFTADHDHRPPRGSDIVTRWIVHTADRSTTPPPKNSNVPLAFTVDLQSLLLATIPHEQVHEYQTHAGARLPRWFAEGHASWVGQRITAQLDPAMAEAKRVEIAGRLDGLEESLDLANWGSVRPKREAIMRQVTPEDRAKMEADPSYSPAGSFRFTQDDLEGDESNMPARYAAALMVFEGLERRHGASAVRDWANDLIAHNGPVTAQFMAETVEAHFGESLEVLLAEPN